MRSAIERRRRAMYGIIRYDYPGESTGWLVRFQSDGIRRMFRDADHDDAEAALAAAKTYRDAVYCALPRRHSSADPPGPGSITRKRVQKRASCSDVLDVYIQVAPNKTAHFKVSIEKWGERGALQRANEWLDRCRAVQAVNFAGVELTCSKSKQ